MIDNNTAIEVISPTTEDINIPHNNKHYTPDNITVREWYVIWITMKEKTVGPNSLRNYKTRYMKDIDPLLGDMPLKDVKTIHCQTVLNEMADKGKKTGTIKDTKVTLSNMLEYAVENEVIVKNPCTNKAIKTDIGQPSTPKTAMTVYEERKFLTGIEGNIYYNQYKLILQTGLRCGELAGLQWSDIDFNQRMLHVNRTMEYHSDGGWRIGKPKSKSSKRTIPLTNEAISVFEAQWNKMSNISKPTEWEDFVFLDGSGHPITSFSYDTMLSALCKEINIPHISMHILRHTFATRCIEAGMKPKTLQSILGHSNLSTTMDLYVHTTEDEKIKEIDAVAAALNAV